jgi:small GTP-binding protein
MNPDYTFKFIIVGDGGVGKSCLLLQFTDRRFEQLHDVTIGVEFGSKQLLIDDKNIKIQIWDTAGQEVFKSIVRSYFRGALGALLVFDITNYNSFHNIKSWLNDVTLYSNFPISMILIGNKSDLESKRQVSKIEAQKFADDNNIQYIETCCKNGLNVDEAFINVAKKILNDVHNGKIDSSYVSMIKKTITPKQKSNFQEQQSCCY